MHHCTTNGQPSKLYCYYKFAFLLTVILFSSIGPLFASEGYKIQPEPDWVVENDFNTEEAAVYEGAISYQLLDRQTHFDGAQSDHYKRLILKVNNTAGLEIAAETAISFDPSYQQLILHKFNIIRNGKIHDKLNSARINLAKTESESQNNILNGEMTALVILRDVKVGDQLDYSFTISGSNPVFGGKFSERVKSGWSVRVGQFDYRVSSPESTPLYYRLKHMPEPKKTVEGGLSKLHWRVLNTERFEYEENTPRWFYDHPEIQLSSYQSWNEVADWGSQLFTDRSLNSPSLSNLLNDLRGLSKEEQIVRALDYTQQSIRYFGIEIGVNSHLPHSPVEVAELGYGDCKDKTLLLISILEALEIDAYPALVNTRLRSTVKDNQPSHGWFNHVITLVELYGQQFWLDPTMSSERGELQFRRASDFGVALVLGHEEKLLEEVPPKPTELASVEVQERIYLGYQHTPARYEVTTTLRRHAANRMRGRLQREGRSSVQKNYLEYMRKHYNGAHLAVETDFQDDTVENEIIIKENYLIDDMYRLDSNRLEFGIYKYTFNGLFRQPESGSRKMPFSVRGPDRWKHHTTIVYPQTFSLDLKNHSSETSHNTDTLFFTSTESHIGRFTMIASELISQNDHIEADDIQNYRKFQKTLNRRLNENHYFTTSSNTQAVSDLMNSILSQLNSDDRKVSLK